MSTPCCHIDGPLGLILFLYYSTSAVFGGKSIYPEYQNRNLVSPLFDSLENFKYIIDCKTNGYKDVIDMYHVMVLLRMRSCDIGKRAESNSAPSTSISLRRLPRRPFGFLWIPTAGFCVGSTPGPVIMPSTVRLCCDRNPLIQCKQEAPSKLSSNCQSRK